MINRMLNLPKKAGFFLFGPRQTGKSTLIKELFYNKKAVVYDLLKTDEYLRLTENPHLFREEILSAKDATHIIIDEIQRVPALLNEIHYLIEGEARGKCFVASGSSARKLKRDKANLLAGRLLSFHLHPLTHVELGDLFNLNKCLEIGTLPKIYLEEDSSLTNGFLKSYVETYLKEEIEAEALVRSSGPFLRFIFQAGYESGNILNYSSVARDSGTSHITVKEYFKILEDTLIGSFLFPFHKSKRKRLAMHPKFYFFDTGVARALSRKLSLKLEPKTSEYGNMFEHWVINEVIRLFSYWQKDALLSYYRTEKGAEVDLVIETARNEIIAVEIKSSDNPYPQDFRNGFTSLNKDVKKIKKICVCTASNPRTVDDIEIMPWRLFFEWLKANT